MRSHLQCSIGNQKEQKCTIKMEEDEGFKEEVKDIIDGIVLLIAGEVDEVI